MLKTEISRRASSRAPVTHRRRSVVPVLAALSVAVGGLLAGCSSDSGSTGSIAVAAATPTASSGSTGSSSNPFLAYSKCMRSNGVTNYPDPVVDSNGGYQMGDLSGVDQNSSTYQSAQAACQSTLYQSNSDSAATRTFDATKVAPWAKCIRANGLPNFPDPTVQGDSIIVSAQAAGISGRDDPKFAKAASACYSIRPGGTLMIVQALK
jgi:hypothetical protein